MSDASGFYEDDEPVEKVRAAFDRGEKGVTRRPRDLNQMAKSIVDEAVTETATESAVKTIVLTPVRGNHPNEVMVKRVV